MDVGRGDVDPGRGQRAGVGAGSMRGDRRRHTALYGTAGPVDTWVWVASEWSELSVLGPGARQEAAMAPSSDTLVLFGGLLSATGDGGALSTALGDTWIWDRTAWSNPTVAGPSARFAAAVAPF